jgi:integrase
MPKHPHNALTAMMIKQTKTPGRYSDGEGLYLVVEETGAKHWILRTVINGRRREMGLGSAILVSLKEARNKAYAARKIAREGGDPIAARRRSNKVVPTFAEAARQVHSDRAGTWKNPKHAAQWINTLQQYAFPQIGERKVSDIESSDIRNVLASIWLTKPETARRLKQRIGVVMDFAKVEGHRDNNPVDGVGQGLPKQSDTKKHHAALPFSEVAAFIRDLRATNQGELVKLAFELLILTATRTSEVLGARWSEIDLEQKVWTIPAERMKKKKEHRVPLAPRAIEIFKRAAELATSDIFVFPGHKRQQAPLSNMVFLMVLRRMEKKITAHGFRSAFRDWTAEQSNFPNEVCEAALAHVITNKTEAAYRRGDLFEKRGQLMNAWAGYVAPPVADVIELRAG